jgi:hypothetical protein
MGSQLAEQIAQLKGQLAYGQSPALKGDAGTGWGLGTSPYAVNPKEAPNTKPNEDRQGNKSLNDTKPTDFEPLYAPEDFATGTYDTHVKGQFDLSQPPQKVEEVRSAPETQQALTQYSDVVGAYVDSEESAIQREQVPLEYQELVKQYFDQLQQASKDDAQTKDGGKDKKDKPAAKPKQKKSNK